MSVATAGKYYVWVNTKGFAPETIDLDSKNDNNLGATNLRKTKQLLLDTLRTIESPKEETRNAIQRPERVHRKAGKRR